MILKVGDLVTVRFERDDYLLAKVLHLESLTLHDVVHLAVYDILLPAGPEGYDESGELQHRTHSVPDLKSTEQILDHIALTYSALEEGDPLVVGHSEVTETEMAGYAIWVAFRRERAAQAGMIHYDVSDEASDEEIDQEIDEEGSEGDEEGSEVGADSITVSVHPWHRRVYDEPLDLIFGDFVEIFRSDEFEGSIVGQRLSERLKGGAEEIQKLVSRLVDQGDYSAGQDLLAHGESAVNPLVDRLSADLDPQQLEDLLQILGDLGVERGYEAIAQFFVPRVSDVRNDKTAQIAARSFCYAVMLTGGSSDALRPHLELIESLDTPELRGDAEAAIKSIQSESSN